VRVFIAVLLPIDLKAKLTALQGEFRRIPLAASWVQEAGFHLTLKFLGEVKASHIGSLAACMSATVQGYEPFSLTFSGVGVFPQESDPRILWVGLEDETGRLRQLRQTLEAELVQIGYVPDDRPFAPHLTLARLKRVSHRGELLAALKTHRRVALGQLGVDHLALIESQLHPSGARYATVKAVYFPKAAESSTVDS
jgi:RNA 2',3'-cyclic 3'-phosphodiesterase